MHRIATAAAAFAAVSAATASAQTFLTEGHFDLEIETEITGSTVDEVKFAIKNKEFPNSPFAEEYEPDEAFLVPGDFRVQSTPLGGIASGSDVYFVPEVQNPDTLWLGLASDDTPLGVLENDEYVIELVGFSGPGTFVASVGDGLGGDTIFIDTSDGINNDSPLIAPISDNHYEYAFDTPGLYELTFTASATTTAAFGSQAISATDTYLFFVPEPATAGLLGVAGLTMLRRRRA
jgi:surface-anchored protein